MEKSTEVDRYIENYPANVREILIKIRKIIREVAPKAKESFGYGMPAYSLNGPLVYFAGHEHHVGLYPTPAGIEAFKDDLKKYKSGKGSVKFPIETPIPFELIKKIVQQRLQENLNKKS